MNAQIISYRSGTKLIRRSSTHKDMWIIQRDGENKWWSINTTEDMMIAMNPPTRNVRYGRVSQPFING